MPRWYLLTKIGEHLYAYFESGNTEFQKYVLVPRGHPFTSITIIVNIAAKKDAFEIAATTNPDIGFPLLPTTISLFDVLNYIVAPKTLEVELDIQNNIVTVIGYR